MSPSLKRCARCHQIKPLKDFHVKGGARSREHHSYCVPCKRELVGIQNKRGRRRNRDAKLARRACHDCGLVVTEDGTHRFDWDHRDPSQKLFTIANNPLKSDHLFYAEVAKCDLVCKICHSDRTEAGRDAGLFKSGRPRLEFNDDEPMRLVAAQESLF